MNRIILVGNGFDLAHKLPTKYEDFINWYSQERLKKFEGNTSKIDEDILCKLEINTGRIYYNSSDTAEEIRKNNSYYQEFYNCNSWYDFYIKNTNGKFKGLLDLLSNTSGKFKMKCSPLFSSITKSIETKGWVDIENEYYNFLCSFLSKSEYEDPKRLNDELDFIRTKLIEYFSKVQDKYINEGILNEEIRDKISEAFNKKDLSIEATEYFKKVPKFDNINYKMNEDYQFYNREQLSPENILILDFNYTKTADLYLQNSKYFQINHIHGDLKNPDSVIFGYGDELDKDYKDLARLNDNEYLRNIKSIKYLESSNYRKILNFIEFDKFQIYIMGHSCGNSDRTLMNTLFEHKNCASIKPFFYKSKAGEDNYLDIVQNISRNFTDMKLMRDRVVNKELCEPLPQNK